MIKFKSLVYTIVHLGIIFMQNFVRNSINVRDETTLSQVWDAFNEATKATAVPPQSNGDNKTDPSPNPPAHDDIANGTEADDTLTTSTAVLEVSELTKKKKKSKKCPMELEDLSTEQTLQENDSGDKKKKKKKSKKHAESKDVVDCCQLNGTVDIKKKDRKRNHGGEDIQFRTKKPKRTDS